MAITTSGTSITFNDATTQTTAPVNTNANVTSATAVAGTGISVTSVTTTGAATHTITNTGVTSLTAGTAISLSGSTGGVTISSTATGTVTSVATGNGLSGGTITTSGTLTIACPSWNSVGSYAFGGSQGPSNSISPGSNYAAGGYGGTNMQAFSSMINSSTGDTLYNPGFANVLSGTWKWMSASNSNGQNGVFGILCRVS